MIESRDWSTWQPTERATLCFVIKDGRILLIEKKRGLGAGKVNGPGGRLEPGETPLQCAVRETQEELCITPLDLTWRGELHFHFTDGYALHCTVFTAADCDGEPTETDEAVPLWTSIDAIPFDKMWADDSHWLPGVLAGHNFRGYFDFDGETMLTRDICWLPANQRPI
jgi:8-oxo-dGTP diphosphatase